MKVFLIRHGETALNREKCFRGRLDVELNERGREQAKRLSERLAREKIGAIYSSPLSRARQTAESIAAPRSLSVQLVEALIDISYGQWEGLAHQKVRSTYPDLYREWAEHPERVSFPGGESLAQVRDRALPALLSLASGKKGEAAVAVVAHRVVNKVLICALLGLDNSHFWQIKQDTAGMTLFQKEGDKYILTLHNDTSYLGAISEEEVDF